MIVDDFDNAQPLIQIQLTKADASILSNNSGTGFINN